MNTTKLLLNLEAYSRKEWDRLNDICVYNWNKNPYTNLHIRLDLLNSVYKLEKSLRISLKLIERTILKLHYSNNLTVEYKNNLYSYLERTRNEIVAQQWDLDIIEKELKVGRSD